MCVLPGVCWELDYRRCPVEHLSPMVENEMVVGSDLAESYQSLRARTVPRELVVIPPRPAGLTISLATKDGTAPQRRAASPEPAQRRVIWDRRPLFNALVIREKDRLVVLARPVANTVPTNARPRELESVTTQKKARRLYEHVVCVSILKEPYGVDFLGQVTRRDRLDSFLEIQSAAAANAPGMTPERRARNIGRANKLAFSSCQIHLCDDR